MGSTGHSVYSYSHTGRENNETFDIAGAMNFKGKVPENSGLKQPGGGKITLRIPDGKNNILFQFHLTKDKEYMMITGYKDGVPEVKCKVKVESNHPSLDKVIAKGNSSERLAATKMKNLMSQSENFKENQLNGIAQKLLKEKQLNR